VVIDAIGAAAAAAASHAERVEMVFAWLRAPVAQRAAESRETRAAEDTAAADGGGASRLRLRALVRDVVFSRVSVMAFDAVAAGVRVSEWAQGEMTPCTVGLPDGTRARDTSLRNCLNCACIPWVDLPHVRECVRAVLDGACVAFKKQPPVFGDFEVLQYGVGSFFALHSDRVRVHPSGRRHLGTLLLVVPQPDCDGGKLVVHVAMPYCASSTDRIVVVSRPSMVFLPLGVVHEVTELLAGARWVAKAAVFGKVDCRAAYGVHMRDVEPLLLRDV
jgi:hypothetical protein